MTRMSIPALLLALALPSPLLAQAMVQAVPGSTDADRLADQMRRLAVSPNDLDALLTAGELSLRLDDLGAAASFFTRAERVDPRNGRVKAGQGAILVHAERPGEALRYFAQAEALGRAPATFAADRGLAYDLIGDNDRAQRDYRLALRTAPNDETVRRYALSLGIAGKRDLAEQQLQPLLRRSDRGAWRAHAFIQAMSGNGGEASHIATTMMPPGTAAGLQPFFDRLPALGTIDRAFAVHFGNARSSPQRLADARLAPPTAALPPDPTAPRLAAAVQPTALAAVDRGKRKRGKGKDAPVAVTFASAPPVPLPQAPAYTTRPGAAPVLAQRGQAPAAWPTAVATASVERGRARGRDESAALANAQAARLAAAPAAIGPGSGHSSTTVPANVSAATPAAFAPRAGATLASAAPLPERDVIVAPARAGAVQPGFTGAVASNATVPAPGRTPARIGGATPAPAVLASTTAAPARSSSQAAAPVVPAVPPAAAPAPVILLAQTAPPVTLAATAPEDPAGTVAPDARRADPPVIASQTRVSVPVTATVVTVPGTAPAPRPVANQSVEAAQVRRADQVAVSPRRAQTAAPAARGADALAAAQPGRAARRSGGTALASIVGGLPIPATELGVRGPRRAAAPTDAQPDDTAPPARADRRGTAARKRAADLAAATDAQPDDPAPLTRAERRSAAARKRAGDAAIDLAAAAEPVDPARAAAAKRAADRKAAADKKKLADAKEAAVQKTEAAREAAAERKLARANPERIWVQVQGGAYKGDLPKAWAAVKAKGGDAFAGQTTGWTTPLRFTNRVLAGPFKTNEEARAFVNRLTAKGMGAFTFTSDAGQVVTRLPAK